MGLAISIASINRFGKCYIFSCISVNKNKCDYCAACIAVCPPDCITVKENDLVVDNDQKIDDISLDQYIDETVSKRAINKLKIYEEIINEKQQKLIFNKSKYLPNNTQVSIGLIKNGQANYYGIKRKNRL